MGGSVYGYDGEAIGRLLAAENALASKRYAEIIQELLARDGPPSTARLDPRNLESCVCGEIPPNRPGGIGSLAGPTRFRSPRPRFGHLPRLLFWVAKEDPGLDD